MTITSTTKTPTKADELNPNSDKEVIYHHVLYLSNGGSSLKEACMIVEKETGQSWGTTKKQYQRRGGSVGSPQQKKHGNRKLTEE